MAALTATAWWMMGTSPVYPPCSNEERMSGCANAFYDPVVASHYEQWYTGRGRRAVKLEKRLFQKLLAGFTNAKTALEIGPGTGHFTRWLVSEGLDVVGLDLLFTPAVAAFGSFVAQGAGQASGWDARPRP